MVASRFPPVASVGAIRVRKFVKYLRRFGWRSVVITGAVRRGTGTAQDARRATDHESLLDLPEDLSVHRLGPVVDNWPGFLTRYCAKALAQLTGHAGFDEPWWGGALKWRFQRMHDQLAFPDRGIWRLPATVALAKSLHRRHRFDALFTSGMPFSDHVIGLVLQSVLRKPWVADFRDPWVEYVHWKQWQTNWGGRLARAAEYAVVSRASHVISVNDHMTRRFVSRYRKEAPHKFVTIQNGYDPADYPKERDHGRRTRFRLLYAGSLYKTRSPRAVLEAFQRFLNQVPGSRMHVRFDFAGRPGPHVDELNRLSNDGTVKYLGMLSHAAALRSMASADVNVIILPNVPGSESDTTAKIYECLGSGRAVLAAVPLSGAAAEVLRRSEGVWLCDPDDVEGIARAMTALYQSWLSGNIQVRRPWQGLREYTREYQAGQLAACLDATRSPRKKRVKICGTGVPPVGSQAGRLCHNSVAAEGRAVPQTSEQMCATALEQCHPDRRTY